MEQDKIDKHFDAVERLINANQRASDLHREASNKAYYNLAIDHAIGVIEEVFISDAYQSRSIVEQLTNLKKN